MIFCHHEPLPTDKADTESLILACRLCKAMVKRRDMHTPTEPHVVFPSCQCQACIAGRAKIPTVC